MKPKAEDYELPDAGEMASQLEEMVRLKERILEEPSLRAGAPAMEEEPPLSAAKPFEPPAEQPVPSAEAIHAEAISFAKAQAEALLQDARVQADRIIEKAKSAAEAEVEEIHQRAITEGYGRGYQEGYAKGQEEAADHMRAAAQKLADETQRILSHTAKLEDETISKLQGELLNIAVATAEKVIHVSLKSSEEVIKRMILSATQKMKRREWVQIYVADCDVKGMVQTDPMLSAALASLSDHVKIVPMKDAESGTCIVEMPDEIIDASASTQLDNIRSIIRENI